MCSEMNQVGGLFLVSCKKYDMGRGAVLTMRFEIRETITKANFKNI